MCCVTSQFPNSRVHDCVSPSAPETEVAGEGAASPCSEGAWGGVWDIMSHVAEENPVTFFGLSNDTARETRKTSCVVQEQNALAPNQPHAKAGLLSLPSHPSMFSVREK